MDVYGSVCSVVDYGVSITQQSHSKIGPKWDECEGMGGAEVSACTPSVESHGLAKGGEKERRRRRGREEG